MYKKYSSDDKQLTLNVSNIKVIVAENLKTQQVRQLIHVLTEKKLSAQEVSSLAKSQRPEVPYPQGRLIICPSRQKKVGRYWQWDVFIAPIRHPAT